MTYLELILKLLYNPKIDLIVCGDININYLENSNKVKQLNDVQLLTIVLSLHSDCK
jgi:hypothetical protein